MDNLAAIGGAIMASPRIVIFLAGWTLVSIVFGLLLASVMRNTGDGEADDNHAAALEGDLSRFTSDSKENGGKRK